MDWKDSQMEAAMGRISAGRPSGTPAIQAQAEVPQLQGLQHSWFCGAWTGYGFHEDGLKSGLAVAEGLLAELRTPLAEAA